jgi:hypothetical protein
MILQRSITIDCYVQAMSCSTPIVIFISWTEAIIALSSLHQTSVNIAVWLDVPVTTVSYLINWAFQQALASTVPEICILLIRVTNESKNSFCKQSYIVSLVLNARQTYLIILVSFWLHRCPCGYAMLNKSDIFRHHRIISIRETI